MEIQRLGLQQSQEAALGLNGIKEYFDSSTPQDTTNVYHYIQVLNDAVFANLSEYLNPTSNTTTDLVASELSGITIPAGTVLYGYFTNLELTSGVVKAVRHK